MGQGRQRINNGFFVTATDTGVGKTVAVLCLAHLLRKKGYDVGVMKPVQCAGDDSVFLKNKLDLKEDLSKINPAFAQEPLSPHIAFPRSGKKISITDILKSYRYLQSRHELMLVEGAGGLMVPLSTDYFNVDLIKDMELPLIIVSRLGLGTINHTLLTIKHAQAIGLKISGVVFCETKKSKKGIAEETNPKAVKDLGSVPVLGTIPYLNNFNEKNILGVCRGKINLNPLFKDLSKENTKTYEALDKKYVWHPFTQMKDWLNDSPLVIERGEGSYLIDTQGNRYLDVVSSLWVNVHGHKHPQIDCAVKKQIDQISHSTFLGLSNVPAVQLAEQLVKIAPGGLKKVFYSDNGSTAVEVAIKMAYQYWQNVGKTKKTYIAHLANSYHGDTLGSVSVGGIDLFHHVYKKLTFPTLKVDLKNFEDVIQKRHAQLAAFVVEPIVQGAAGMIVWPKGILKRMAQVCKKYDVLFIVDEVATGFGRTGKMFACEHEGVKPDILCVAKGLTGGYLPLAATLTTQRVFDGFLFDYKHQKAFFHGHTYTANPLACAAALANLKLFEKEKTLSKLQAKIKVLDNKLQMFYNLAHVGDVRTRGFMVGIELVKDKKSKKPYPWQDRLGVKVCQKCRERGVILRPLGNVIVLMPPLSISFKELNELLDVTYWAIDSVTT